MFKWLLMSLRVKGKLLWMASRGPVSSGACYFSNPDTFIAFICSFQGHWTWCVLCLYLPAAYSLNSFRNLLKFHLFNEVFLTCLFKIMSSSSLHPSFLQSFIIIFFYCTCCHVTKYILYVNAIRVAIFFYCYILAFETCLSYSRHSIYLNELN